MLRGVGVGTFDAHGFRDPTQRRNSWKSTITSATLRRSLPWRKKKKWRVAKWKSLANGVLRSRAAHSPGADGEKRRVPPMKGVLEALADGAQATLAAIPADGVPHLAARQADGALPAEAEELPVRTKRGKQRKSR
ncbi:unnamed protein product [Closterium sp. NIES-54]